MSTANDQHKEFALSAHPQSWFIVADNLHSQAFKLYGQRGMSYYSLRIGDEVRRWDAISKSVFLLCGFALENAIKAFLVFENPQWVSNGRLAKQLKNHSLTELSSLSDTIPYKYKYNRILRVFESGLESWARYPCTLTIDTLKEEPQNLEEVWPSYCKLITAYGRRLERLLGTEWVGPHGITGSVETSGHFFSIK
ncbi:hypothetical protein J0X12_07700 [Sneathiella sp. CAU 1612]|uniref:HEPN domain-containing protein n=1 Tax=Sneathiella sedimenti TaxID=2816034 RepID=A0ABS3F6B2_9PROT|nr:hypothetical protein [Sneathiella sedimenti]MBO0333492.1 hypothetical protein [Sneathiella sedimenti]